MWVVCPTKTSIYKKKVCPRTNLNYQPCRRHLLLLLSVLTSDTAYSVRQERVDPYSPPLGSAALVATPVQSRRCTHHSVDTCTIHPYHMYLTFIAQFSGGESYSLSLLSRKSFQRPALATIAVYCSCANSLFGSFAPAIIAAP